MKNRRNNIGIFRELIYFEPNVRIELVRSIYQDNSGSVNLVS